jgi:hypothetical protein
MPVKLLKYLWILPLIYQIQACNVNDAKNIEGPVTYNPTFSVPIGKDTLHFRDIFRDMNLRLTDTISGTDTLYLLWYKNNLYIDSLGYFDTTIFADFNFNFFNERQEIIKSVMFRINYMSELSCNSTIQLLFEDAGGNVMDSLFADGPLLIAAADTNRQGIVESAEHRQKDVFFSKNKVNMLQQVSRLELKLHIKTGRADNKFYKFLGRYIVYIQLGVRVEIEAKL